MSLIKNVFPNFKTTTSYNALINLKSENDNGESNSYKPYMDSNLINDQKYKFNSNYDSQTKDLQENFTPPSSNYAVIPQKSSVPQIYNFTGGNTISPNGMNLPQIPTETTIQPNNRFTQLFEEYAPVTNTISPFQMQNQSNNLTSSVNPKNIYIQDTNQQQSQNQTIDHNSVMTHMSSCQICRDTFIKQYNLEQSKIYREELMELISYISFSILIIIIIDSLM